MTLLKKYILVKTRCKAIFVQIDEFENKRKLVKGRKKNGSLILDDDGESVLFHKENLFDSPKEAKTGYELALKQVFQENAFKMEIIQSHLKNRFIA